MAASQNCAAATMSPLLLQVSKRSQYTQAALEHAQLDPTSPFATFLEWFGHACESGLVSSPEAVTLATAHLPSGRVSARMVLMKQVDGRGFIVYSNWETSRKAHDICSNPRASITFWWEQLERQVRIEGWTERLTSDESAAYFHTRPRDAQIGAWASPQSTPIENRIKLENLVAARTADFRHVDSLPVPPQWGGMRIVPDYVEFWQGRPPLQYNSQTPTKRGGRLNRLHDRFAYQREKETDPWQLARLAP